MLSCGHERTSFGAPLCTHLRTCREATLDYVQWYIGSGLDVELLCVACAEARERGVPVEVDRVCEECFEYAATDFGGPLKTRGTPGICTRPEPFSTTLRETAIPSEAGRIVDVAPVDQDGRSVWLMLAESGAVIRLSADTGEWQRVASLEVPLEPDHEPWFNHDLRTRLHSSRRGKFAAVVNDYGRYGRLIDLRSGKVTLALDGGDYDSETVPFSFAFGEVQGRVVAIHRTAWNRLDVSDPSTGELLTDRGPTSYQQGEQKPEHYLDYFHGAIYVSPGGAHVVDDGWVWHPAGIPTAWSLGRWLGGNVWESEDGASRFELCVRTYYWDHAVAWIDEKHVAIGGIGNDDLAMIDGVRIFDVTLPANGCGESQRAREIQKFAGPAGKFFADGTWLFSSGESDLSRWDTGDGARTGMLQNFRPTHHHRGARELVQLIDGVLLRWNTG